MPPAIPLVAIRDAESSMVIGMGHLLLRLTMLLCLAGFSGARLAQDVMRSPVRSRDLSLFGGNTAIVTVPRLEPGRLYVVRVIVSGQGGPSEEGWLDIHLTDSGRPVAEGRLDRLTPILTAAVLPDTPNGARIRISAGGEMNAAYSVRVEWQAAWLSRMPGAGYIASPNQNLRPDGAAVNTVVVHATVIPTLERTLYHFLNPQSKVSAHYVVGKDGSTVQMVEDSARAWHAGVSELDGVTGVNDFSVGIEIVNLNDGKDPYTDAQYTAVASIIRHLREQYEIPDSRIVSHAHVARPVGRKSDPVGFDFRRLVKMVAN